MTSVSNNDFSSAATFKCKAMAVGVFVSPQTHTTSLSHNVTFFHEEMVCVFPKGDKKKPLNTTGRAVKASGGILGQIICGLLGAVLGFGTPSAP